MLRQKRISKETISPPNFRPKNQKKKNVSARKDLDLQRCVFKVIPSPNKFTHNFMIHHLYGDIVLIEKNGCISSDMSLITKFKEFRDIEVRQVSSIKLVQVTLDRKEIIHLAPWEEIVQRLEKSPYVNLKNWAVTIKAYCTRYEDFIQALQLKNIKIEVKQEAGNTRAVEKKKTRLFNSFPCIHLKIKHEEEYGIEVKEISYNTQLLEELGHSQESFVTTVFQEGIPQILSQNVEANSSTIKMLLDNYFTLDEEGLETPEFEHLLFMKSNYTKKASVKTHFFMNNEEGKFGIDAIIVIQPLTEPLLDYRLVPKKVFKPEFLKERIEQEQIQANFLSTYYNMSFDLRFTQMDKVCALKELPLVNEEYFYYEE